MPNNWLDDRLFDHRRHGRIEPLQAYSYPIDQNRIVSIPMNELLANPSAPTLRKDLMSKQLVDPTALRRRIHADLERLAEAEALAARFPSEPPVHAVLRFQRQFPNNDRVYYYSAFRAPNGNWYLTGQAIDNTTPSWPELRDLIGNEPCDMAMDWAEIPTSEPEAVDQVTDPAKWYELVWGKKADEEKPADGKVVIDQQD